MAFHQEWAKLEVVVPGTIKLLPQDDLREVLEVDYEAMRSMIFHKGPALVSIMELIQIAEDTLNRR